MAFSAMDDLLLQPSHVAALAVALVTSIVSIVCYRLFFHPLSGFPGPKLAAITRYYEAYYDLCQNGQYTFKIAKLHREYGDDDPTRTCSASTSSDLLPPGPIIRISPYELHVSDPTFFDTLYRNEAQYDKYAWAVDAFAGKGAALFTVEHAIHRARRQPLSPFFSKSKVASQQDLIRRHLDRLVGRLTAYAETQNMFDFGAAATAFVRDVTNDYVLGKSYNSLGRDDFDVSMLAASQGSGAVWRLTKFVRFVAALMQSLPPSWIVKIAGDDVKEFFLHLEETQQDTRNLMAAASSPGADGSKQRTVVHEIMESKLPASEKKFKRIFQDVSTVTGAGFETTASVLRLVCFHIFSNPRILSSVRAELASLTASSEQPLDLKSLEQLPYLTSVIREGLRLSPAIATRMARVCPDADIAFKHWRIPAGTPVGMTLVLMHTDEALYPDPEKFDPERWMQGGALSKASLGFAPFSKGTRSCLGMYLAWAELYIGIACLVQRFDFRFPSATAGDFLCESDQFAIGTKGKGHLEAFISTRAR